MAHKNNKNVKEKVKQKTKTQLKKMQIEMGNEIGYSKESKKLGNDDPRPYTDGKKHDKIQEIKDIMKSSDK